MGSIWQLLCSYFRDTLMAFNCGKSVWLNKSNFTLADFSAASSTKVQNNFSFVCFIGPIHNPKPKPKLHQLPTQTCHPCWHFLVRYLLATFWQAAQIGSSRDSLSPPGQGFIKRKFIIYINSFVLFAVSIRGTWPRLSHPLSLSATPFPNHLPQSLNSSAKLWENLVYQRAFVTIKQGIISWRGFNVAPVKVVITQNHREKVNEKGKTSATLTLPSTLATWDRGPPISRSSHLRFTFFFGSPGCWALAFNPLPIFIFCQSIMMAGNVSFWSSSPWNMQRAVKKTFYLY